MNGCGDKLVTTQEPAICAKAKKPKWGKPVASAKFGSAVVPIYRLGSDDGGGGSRAHPASTAW